MYFEKVNGFQKQELINQKEFYLCMLISAIIKYELPLNHCKDRHI